MLRRTGETARQAWGARDRGRAFLASAAAAVAMTALAAPAAPAASFAQILDDYKADGAIAPCAYSEADLKAARAMIPADLVQYAPGLVDQINAALEAWARGDCDKGAQKERATPVPAAPPPAPPPASGPEPPPAVTPVERILPPPEPPRTPKPSPRLVAVPAAQIGARAADAPAPVLLLGTLGGLATLALVLAVATHRYGWSPERWSGPVSHSFREAGARVADGLADLWDRIRVAR